MPFAGFENWEACILAQKDKGHDEDSANRICGFLKNEFENLSQTVELSEKEKIAVDKCVKLSQVKTFANLECEIFAIGKWNGDKYNALDLQEMVTNFDALKGTVKPPAKIGHSESQDLLKAEGLPAAGWVDKLKLVGNKVVATFRDVPKVIKDLIDKKAYKRVSAEIYPSYKDPVSGKTFKNVLRAVAFLGQDIPAVESLSDIVALYKGDNSQEFKVYDFDSNAIFAPKCKVQFVGKKYNIKISELSNQS